MRWFSQGSIWLLLGTIFGHGHALPDHGPPPTEASASPSSLASSVLVITTVSTITIYESCEVQGMSFSGQSSMATTIFIGQSKETHLATATTIPSTSIHTVSEHASHTAKTTHSNHVAASTHTHKKDNTTHSSHSARTTRTHHHSIDTTASALGDHTTGVVSSIQTPGYGPSSYGSSAYGSPNLASTSTAPSATCSELSRSLSTTSSANGFYSTPSSIFSDGQATSAHLVTQLSRTSFSMSVSSASTSMLQPTSVTLSPSQSILPSTSSILSRVSSALTTRQSTDGHLITHLTRTSFSTSTIYVTRSSSTINAFSASKASTSLLSSTSSIIPLESPSRYSHTRKITPKILTAKQVSIQSTSQPFTPSLHSFSPPLSSISSKLTDPPCTDENNGPIPTTPPGYGPPPAYSLPPVHAPTPPTNGTLPRHYTDSKSNSKSSKLRPKELIVSITAASLAALAAGFGILI
ncbi:hypothetical protein EG329_009061 [Mollisiaceae sp. DMI_Dod_QoI]|nr:hypothetical protein EG329_009061 [Helotiales sp. DMI_Dod_QoI]